MSKGLTVVFKWQRIRLRVFWRFFYPISPEMRDHILYSDTGREREINYRHPEDYGLETPFDRINMIRLARAMDRLDASLKRRGSVSVVSPYAQPGSYTTPLQLRRNGSPSTRRV